MPPMAGRRVVLQVLHQVEVEEVVAVAAVAAVGKHLAPVPVVGVHAMATCVHHGLYCLEDQYLSWEALLQAGQARHYILNPQPPASAAASAAAAVVELQFEPELPLPAPTCTRTMESQQQRTLK